MKEFKKWILSESVRRVLYTLSILVIALLIFHAGVVVGAHHRFPDGGGPAFGFRGHGFDVRLPRGAMPNGHGAVGTIQSISTSSLTLQTRDGAARNVLLTDKTSIRTLSGAASSTVLSIGQQIIVLGTPNSDDTISADLIRTAPGPMRDPAKKVGGRDRAFY